MLFLSICVRKYRKLDNTPFLSIHKFTLMIRVNIFRNLTFVYLDSKIRNSKTAYAFH